MAATKYILTILQTARFWSNIDVREDNECWEWKRSVDSKGYGTVRLNGKTQAAHRIAYSLAYGEITSEAIRHTCDNEKCCNPLHLIEGSHAENVADRVIRNRSAIGQKNGRAKLTLEQVKEIIMSQESTATLAIKYGVAKRTIQMARNGENWKFLHEAMAA